MGDIYIDSLDQLHQALQYWKNFLFVADYIKLDNAIDTLGTPQALVECRQEYAARWLLSKVGSRGPKEAILHTAAIWRWGSDMETGNFVPHGEQASSRVAESRIQDTPNNLCQFSYAFDTTRDKALWTAQQAFEKLAQDTQGFNPAKKTRRAWQDGSNGNNTDSYVMSAQIFSKRSRYSGKREASIKYPLHPWITEATKKPSVYYANPDRPKIFQAVHGALQNITESGQPPYLKTGDLVWLSFSVEFIIGTTSWATTFTPCEIVRVGEVSPDLLGRAAPPSSDDDGAPRGQLEVGHTFTMHEDFPMFQPQQSPMGVIPPTAVSFGQNVFSRPTSSSIDAPQTTLNYSGLSSAAVSLAESAQLPVHTPLAAVGEGHEAHIIGNNSAQSHVPQATSPVQTSPYSAHFRAQGITRPSTPFAHAGTPFVHPGLNPATLMTSDQMKPKVLLTIPTPVDRQAALSPAPGVPQPHAAVPISGYIPQITGATETQGGMSDSLTAAQLGAVLPLDDIYRGAAVATSYLHRSMVSPSLGVRTGTFSSGELQGLQYGPITPSRDRVATLYPYPNIVQPQAYAAVSAQPDILRSTLSPSRSELSALHGIYVRSLSGTTPPSAGHRTTSLPAAGLLSEELTQQVDTPANEVTFGPEDEERLRYGRPPLLEVRRSASPLSEWAPTPATSPLTPPSVIEPELLDGMGALPVSAQEPALGDNLTQVGSAARVPSSTLKGVKRPAEVDDHAPTKVDEGSRRQTRSRTANKGKGRA